MCCILRLRTDNRMFLSLKSRSFCFLASIQGNLWPVSWKNTLSSQYISESGLAITFTLPSPADHLQSSPSHPQTSLSRKKRRRCQRSWTGPHHPKFYINLHLPLISSILSTSFLLPVFAIYPHNVTNSPHCTTEPSVVTLRCTLLSQFNKVIDHR